MAIHVLEDGVFDRVMSYEMGKVQAYREERDAKRRSGARSRTYSQSKPSKSSLGSDDGQFACSVMRPASNVNPSSILFWRIHPSTILGIQVHSRIYFYTHDHPRYSQNTA